MIGKLLRHLSLKREIDRNLKARKQARAVRSEAAHRGHSTYWRNVGSKTRALFGGE